MKTNNHKTHTLNGERASHHFRVTIFGSARIKENDKIYKQVFNLAKEIGKHRFDLVTGGGPGLMNAASSGHQEGDTGDYADSIGLTIRLPWEVKANKHLEIKEHFDEFSGRLDEFMKLSNVVVVMPGGIGTSLELFYTWQLIQVRHIRPIPVILIGGMWKDLVEWVKKWQVKHGLADKQDLDNIHVVKSNKEAMKIILKAYKEFKEEGAI